MSEKTLESQVSLLENITQDIQDKLYRVEGESGEDVEKVSPASKIGFAINRLSNCHENLCKISETLSQISGKEDYPA